jgi:hemerythrin-like metal-binding protein
MEEQNTGSRQILEAIEKLNEITRTVKTGAEEMRERSKAVIEEGKNLKMVTAEITGGMNEMAYRAEEVNSSVTHVNSISRKNKSNIDILREAISHFTITDKHYFWNDSLCIGVDLIDEQHKALFDQVNSLIDAIERGAGTEELKKALDFLTSYTVTHFNDEEVVQKKYAYPAFETHHKIHERFKKVAVDLASDFMSFGSSEALVKEVKRKIGDWLVTHVKGEDARIGAYIRKMKNN